MHFNEKQLNFIYDTSKNIILEQPQVLAERIVEIFTSTQSFQSRELVEYACKYPIYKLTKSLKNKGFNENEIKCCSLFISLFTKEIINQSTKYYQHRFNKSQVISGNIVPFLTVIINDISSYEVKHFETKFESFLNIYKN